MHEMYDHRRPLAIHGMFPRLMKMKLGQEIRLRADFQPEIIRKKDFDLVMIAIIEDLQINRLVVKVDWGQAQFFRMRYIDGGLYVSGITCSLPMAGIVRARCVREMRIALLRCVRDLRVVRAGMVLARLSFVLGLGDLTRSRRSHLYEDQEAQTGSNCVQLQS